MVWDFVRQKWSYLVERFSLNDRLFARLLPTLAEGFADEDRLREMRDHFDKYPEAGAGAQSRRIALETVKNNIKFAERHADPVREWLLKNN